MSDMSGSTGADGIPEGQSVNAPAGGDDVRDEVRLDLDEPTLDTWDEVRGDYAVDPESEMARPALTESEDSDEDDEPTRASEDDEEDDEAQDDDGSGDEEE